MDSHMMGSPFLGSDGFTYFDQSMEGKVALITGAASGIGRATAIEFAKKKVKVVVVDLNEQGGKQVVETIKGEKGEANFMKVDVTSKEDVANMIESTVKLYGGLHYAHNNVGIEGERNLTHLSSFENFENVMKIDCKSVFLCMKYELAQMISQQSKNTSGKVVPCSIVNTAAISGVRAMPEFSAYTAAKHAVIGLTKTAAFEYAKQHIRVNAVAPGTVSTAMLNRFNEKWPEYQAESNSDIPMDRTASASEIANAVVWLSSPSSSYVTGHVLILDGGRTLT